MMIVKAKRSFLYASILYLFGFFLFLEWLYPAVNIGDTSNFFVFIIYAAFCFFISFLQVKWWLSFLLKGFSLLFVINHLFYVEAFLQREWLTLFIDEVSLNISVLFAQNWFDLTNLFRTVLFLFLIWLMSYLIHYWFLEVKRIMLFIILTFIYITVLDTFTTYDATLPVIRIFVLSFLAFGMVNIYQTISRESISFKWFKNSPAWAIPIVFVVLVSALIGYETPHYPPQWEDPVPFLISTATGNDYRNAPIQKSGYGENDSQLGGSFIQDDTPVFQASAKEKFYYRIETKDLYTGKGWVNSQKPKLDTSDASVLLYQTFSENVVTEPGMVKLDFAENVKFDKIVYPYGIEYIHADFDIRFVVDQSTGVIRANKFNDYVQLDTYRIDLNVPLYDIAALRQDRETDPGNIKEQYTQLPTDLPDRVSNLATEITETYDNRYEKAKAIEQYFGQAGFMYQTTDIPIPQIEDDYVDQFLFDSQVGYCDNYSTSMVVMLRTLDIPARWVKGFTGGEKITTEKNTDDSDDLYQVTNANAHSWVEVYFPETGWVPFEPTQGFENHSNFEDSSNELDQEDAEIELDESDEPEEVEQVFPEDEEEEIGLENTSPFEKGENEKGFSYYKWYVLGVIVLIVILLTGSIILYRFRYHIKTSYLIKKYHNKIDEGTYLKLYEHMLSLLSHYGLAIGVNETLREYADRVDEVFGSNEMNVLTRIYEKILYNNQVDDLKHIELLDLYEHMTKNILRKD